MELGFFLVLENKKVGFITDGWDWWYILISVSKRILSNPCHRKVGAHIIVSDIGK